MKLLSKLVSYLLLLSNIISCTAAPKPSDKTAKEILGNPNYQAICYSGYRENNRDARPTLEQTKEDLKILAALNFKIVRTYKTKYNESSIVLEAIKELKKEDPKFEMYMMLGVWIDCENAFTNLEPNHNAENLEANELEIKNAVALAKQYPDIVKIIAVGNEAMVKWATSYYVQPNIILKWVNYLQKLKKENVISKDIWITSSDNFASWGGGGSEYHTPDLEKLIKAVDYISMHTYPMHDTHYNPNFWKTPESEKNLSKKEKIDAAMLRAKNYAKGQYAAVKKYMKSLGVDKPIHIGETGWASSSDGFYGNEGSRATDEYKQKIYYDAMRAWTNKENITCFYFEAFDEIWKDAANPAGSENHFGLFKVDGTAKYVLWGKVDDGTLAPFSRDGKPITKSYNGSLEKLFSEVEAPK